MSGNAPYTYVSCGDDALLASVSNDATGVVDALLYVYDADTLPIIALNGVNLFNQGCLTARYTDQPDPEHPVGSYNIAYPYCRTGLRFRMDDPRSNPQIGQLVPPAPIVSVKVTLDGCDLSELTSVVSRLEPRQAIGCGAELFPGYTPTEFFVVMDRTLLTFPCRLTFTVKNGRVTKEFWIGFRDARDGVPSGAVV